MSQYRKGRRFEYTVRDHFEGEGYVVVRAAGSKPLDLICMKDGSTYLVECKTRGRLTRAEREKLLEIAAAAGAIPVLAYNDSGEVKLEKIQPHERRVKG